MLGSAKKKTDALLLFFLGLTACIRGKRFASSVSVDQIRQYQEVEIRALCGEEDKI